MAILKPLSADLLRLPFLTVWPNTHQPWFACDPRDVDALVDFGDFLKAWDNPQGQLSARNLRKRGCWIELS